MSDSEKEQKVHIHRSDTGEHIGQANQMDLHLMLKDYLYGVGYGEGNILHLWVCNGDAPKLNPWKYRLVAYKVRFKTIKPWKHRLVAYKMRFKAIKPWNYRFVDILKMSVLLFIPPE